MVLFAPQWELMAMLSRLLELSVLLTRLVELSGKSIARQPFPQRPEEYPTKWYVLITCQMVCNVDNVAYVPYKVIK